ncbi:MAG: lipase family protein [Flavobacteriia bacterium]|nr:lipase family protein [Flavobacteriia bacterium]
MKYFLLLLLLPLGISAQYGPGFNIDEYREMLLISAHTGGDSAYSAQFDAPENHVLAYSSPSIGLDNKWELWVNRLEKTAVISIRGTTQNPESWMLNFYAAMIPAQGEIKWMTDGEPHQFKYHMADHPEAAVHAGWTLGCGMLLQDILPKIYALWQEEEIENFYIMGHSQGGAIAYLMNAQLAYMSRSMMLPQGWRFKTYCSAAPKPGNLHFAHDYEARTQNGWAFNVVNAADWVPEVPISIQTLDDFNETNPLVMMEDMIARQELLDRIGLWWAKRQLENPARDAQENYEQYLGERIQEQVEKRIEGLEMPGFYHSNNYVRTGIQIVLQPDDEYKQTFVPDSGEVFIHHLHKPYLFLTERLGTPFYDGHEFLGIQWKLKSWLQEDEMQEFKYGSNIPWILFTREGRVHGWSAQENGYPFSISFIIIDGTLTIYRDWDMPEGEQGTRFTRMLSNCNRMEFRDNQLLMMNRNRILMIFENQNKTTER